MTENPYQVLAPSVASMLGRMSLVRRIENYLLKPTPDHISVVGPRHYGKTVLLRHLARVFLLGSSGYRVLPPGEPTEPARNSRAGSNDYLATVYIDLRHDTPGSDGAFWQRFAEEIKATFKPDLWEPSGQPYLQKLLGCIELSEFIDIENETGHKSLDCVFAELEDIGARILVVLDGFDCMPPVATPNLWDQLRSLAQKSRLSLVTGSRRPLRELCRAQDSRTSSLWEIFYDIPSGLPLSTTLTGMRSCNRFWTLAVRSMNRRGRRSPIGREACRCSCARFSRSCGSSTGGRRGSRSQRLTEPPVQCWSNGMTSLPNCGTTAMWSYAPTLVRLPLPTFQ